MFSISRIHQVLQAIPRGAFERSVEQHNGDRYVKSFFCWDQLVTMVYVQLAGARGLRELQQGFNANAGQHYHLGVRAVARSTLADANERRTPAVFADTVKRLIEQAGRTVRAQREELLYLIDSSCVNVPLAHEQRRGLASAHDKYGMKLHVLLNGQSAAIAGASVTPANVHDLLPARALAIEAGATYVFDKGYCDYNWWQRIDAAGAMFVTRFKGNAALNVLCEKPVPDDAPQILGDSLVAFATRTPRGGHRNLYSAPLRRIQVARPDAAPLVLATNDLRSPAAHIAQLYRRRWGIELFFKWVKQHLQIRHFVGRNDNAIRIQVLTALIAYLLVLLLKRSSGFAGSLWMLLAELRHNLFQRAQLQQSYWRRRRDHLALVAAIQPSLL